MGRSFRLLAVVLCVVGEVWVAVCRSGGIGGRIGRSFRLMVVIFRVASGVWVAVCGSGESGGRMVVYAVLCALRGGGVHR